MRTSLRSLLPLLLLLAACGHVHRGTIGPTVTGVTDDGSDTHVGVELGGEVGAHLLGSTIVSLPVGLRGHVAVFDDGRAEAMFGLTYGFWVAPPPRIDREDDESGFTVRGALAGGGLVTGDGLVGALRGSFALGHGRMRRGRHLSSSCSGSDKFRSCSSWTRWTSRAYGAELAYTHATTDPRTFRLTAAFYLEDVAISDWKP